jgi:hypothetical protein
MMEDTLTFGFSAECRIYPQALERYTVAAIQTIA